MSDRVAAVRGVVCGVGLVFGWAGVSTGAVEPRESVVLGAEATREALRAAAESLRLAEAVDSVAVAKDLSGRRTILVTDWSRFARDGDVWAVLAARVSPDAARVAPGATGGDGFPSAGEPIEAGTEMFVHGKADARTGLARMYYYRSDFKQQPRGIGITDVKASEARAAERAKKWPEAPAIEPEKLPTFAMLDCGSPLRGRLLDGSRVVETLEAAAAGRLVGRRGSDGLITLEATTPRGAAVMRVDPDRGHVLVGFRVTWGHADEFEGKPLWKSLLRHGDQKAAGDIPTTDDQRVRAELRVEVTRAERVPGLGSGDGAWVAAAGDVVASMTVRSGSECVQQRRVRRVTLDAAHEDRGLLAREVTAADGTPARLTGSTGGVTHEWRGGKPVAKVNEKAVAKLSRVAEFASPEVAQAMAPGGGSGWRGPGTGASVLLGVGAGAVLIFAVAMAGRVKAGGR